MMANTGRERVASGRVSDAIFDLNYLLRAHEIDAEMYDLSEDEITEVHAVLAALHGLERRIAARRVAMEA